MDIRFICFVVVVFCAGVLLGMNSCHLAHAEPVLTDFQGNPVMDAEGNCVRCATGKDAAGCDVASAVVDMPVQRYASSVPQSYTLGK
jgi:hypothetical protein